MIEIYLMIFCAFIIVFIIVFIIFTVIDRILSGEWYTIYSVRYEHMRSVMRMWIGDI